MTRLNLVHSEEHDGADEVDMETHDNDLRQLNYIIARSARSNILGIQMKSDAIIVTTQPKLRRW